MNARFCILAVIACLCMQIKAAELPDSVRPYRPVVGAYTLGIGSSHICNTYLTPLRYSGMSATLSYERMQAMAFSPERWIMQLNGALSLDRAHNPAHNATMTGIELRLSWAMMRRWRVPSAEGLSLSVGGTTELSGGGLLLARNSNNPAQAIASWNIGVAASAIYNFNVRRLPVTLRYQARMPIAGIFFSPDYGELYYEIYLGNHSGLVHAAWPGNYRRIDQLVTADLHLGNTSLRLGYACDFFSSKASDIVARNIAHRFVIGVTVESISIGRSRGIDPHARIISAIY